MNERSQVREIHIQPIEGTARTVPYPHQVFRLAQEETLVVVRFPADEEGQGEGVQPDHEARAESLAIDGACVLSLPDGSTFQVYEFSPSEAPSPALATDPAQLLEEAVLLRSAVAELVGERNARADGWEARLRGEHQAANPNAARGAYPTWTAAWDAGWTAADHRVSLGTTARDLDAWRKATFEAIARRCYGARASFLAQDGEEARRPAWHALAERARDDWRGMVGSWLRGGGMLEVDRSDLEAAHHAAETMAETYRLAGLELWVPA